MARIIFFGDSITKAGSNPDGYITQLQQSTLKGWQVINAGVDGDNIADLQARLTKDVLCHAPNLVVLKVGINDSAPYEGKAALPLDEFIIIYQSIINKIIESGAQLVLCTPTILGESVSYPYVGDADINLYAQKIVELAQINHLPLADLRAAFVAARLENNLQNQEFGILTTDGVHLSAQGQALAAKILQKTLANLLKIAWLGSV